MSSLLGYPTTNNLPQIADVYNEFVSDYLSHNEHVVSATIPAEIYVMTGLEDVLSLHLQIWCW